MPLAVLVIHASRAIAEIGVIEARRFGYDLTEPDMLAFLSVCEASETSGVTAARLTSTLKRDKTTLSRCISRLERIGLVHTELDPLDGRQKLILPTEDGLGLGESLRAHLQNESERAASGLSVEDVEAIETFLEKLCLR